MPISTTTKVVAVAGAGVALIAGYLVLGGKKAHAAPPVKTLPKKGSGGGALPKKGSGGGGGGGGGSGGSKSAGKNYKLMGYNAGLQAGKADKAKGGFGIFTMTSFPSTVPADRAGEYFAGYADGFPVGYGKSGSGAIASRYSTDSVDGGGDGSSDGSGDATTTDSTGGDTSGDGSSSDGTTDVSSSGVSTGQTMAHMHEAMHHTRRPVGTWGPRQHALAIAAIHHRPSSSAIAIPNRPPPGPAPSIQR